MSGCDGGNMTTKCKAKLMFEVFPPKTEAGLDKLCGELDKLIELKPDCISVTHGANGSNVGRQMEVLRYIKQHGCACMANVTCIDKTREDISRFVAECEEIGVDRIFCVRGDLPKGYKDAGGDFAHASDLIVFVHSLTDIPIGAACYPEGHIEDTAYMIDSVLKNIKRTAGASFFVSQMCYHPFIMGQDMYDDIFVGIMPVLDRERVTEMALKNGVSIPKGLARIMGRYWDDPDGFRKAGKEYTVKIANWLIGNGSDKFQIFTMNRADDVIEIVKGAGLR